MSPLLSVTDLRVDLVSGFSIVKDVSLSVEAGEVLSLVGESGSGKTTLAKALLGFAEPGVEIRSGRITVSGKDLAVEDLARLRGARVAYVPQDPMGALNPSMRVGRVVGDMIDAHAPDATDAPALVRRALERAQLPTDDDFLRRYPHQLSGGQQQRVVIALALSCDPEVIVLDEPTTGLDVITQAAIIEQVDSIRSERNVAIVYVTHDLALVSGIADRLSVMYAGRVVEEGPAAAVLADPRHPYTRGLIASVPDHLRPRRLQAMPGVAAGVEDEPTGCAFAPRCPLRVDACVCSLPPMERTSEPQHRARCIRWRDIPPLRAGDGPLVEPSRVATAAALLRVDGLSASYPTRRGPARVVDDVSFEIESRACVALVGESGSGKTTIARTIAGLHPPAAGEVLLDDVPLPAARSRTPEQHRRVQIIFQNPGDALNPRRSVRDQVARPASLLLGLSRTDANARVIELLERVRLPATCADRYPDELSGGERQRVGIARALAAKPDLIICDEITSALDVSVQAAVLLLLIELRNDLGLSLLLITHDLGVVANIADRTLVLDRGVICEQGATADVLRSPSDPYTQSLLAAAPTLAITNDGHAATGAAAAATSTDRARADGDG